MYEFLDFLYELMVRSVIRMAVGLTGNNYSIKMDEDKLLNNLLDFSRLTKQP